MVYIMSCSFTNMEIKIKETDSFYFVGVGGVRFDTALLDLHDQPVPCCPTFGTLCPGAVLSQQGNFNANIASSSIDY